MFGFGTKGTEMDPTADSVWVASFGVPSLWSHICAPHRNLEGSGLSAQNKLGSVHNDETLGEFVRQDSSALAAC